MRYLITGIAGFVGSNLARRLFVEGHEVIGIDNFSHGKRENIEGLPITFIEGDVSQTDLMDIKFDICVHLASQKIPRESSSYKTVTENYEMLDAVISACYINNARLLFASTSDVYGVNNNLPFSETSALCHGLTSNKRWSYAASKIHGEHYIYAAAQELGLKATIMRFFSAFGPRQAAGWWGGVQSAFMDAIRKGEDIVIHGNGLQTRCFTYIDDLIDGIMLCTKDEAIGEIYNIGNPSNLMSINTLADVLQGMYGKKVGVSYDIGKKEEATAKIPDITKIRELGFNPVIDLMLGLKLTKEWLESSR